MRRLRENGFTLIELMIVVVIIGILAAVAIPNFISLTKRAQEATVKSNMHTVQMSIEDFAVQNNSFYPVAATTALADGRTLADVCPGGTFPTNPFTDLASVMQFNAQPSSGSPGELALNPALDSGYWLKANGPDGDTLRIVLTTGG